MKIALHGKSTSKEAQACLSDLVAALKKRDAALAISDDFRGRLQNSPIFTTDMPVFRRGDDLGEFDFILSLGGDGAMLDTVTYTGAGETPIVGVNLGRLGFLATTPGGEIEEAVEMLCEGAYFVESRSLVHVSSNLGLFEPYNFGLNEFTILKKETSSMILIHTYVDGDYLNAYWADGLIVSTPTGSTGYSLSCGGPLVHPKLKNFIITPVSPHNLNVRPIIVSDTSEITFKIEGRSKQFMVSLDSRSSSVNDKVEISVKREAFEANLVRFKKKSYFDTLRHKLNWGVDARN